MTWKIAAAAVTGFLLGYFTGTATAKEKQNRGDWFESLKQPNTGYSCCDISDCKQTIAEWRGNGWVAKVPDRDGGFASIPPEKVLENPKTIDGEAYVCSSPTGRIYCFVPPWSGF